MAITDFTGEFHSLQVARVALAPEQLRCLHSSPVVIVPAPPSDRVILPVSFFAKFQFGSQPYTSPANGAGIYFQNDLHTVIFHLRRLLLSSHSALMSCAASLSRGVTWAAHQVGQPLVLFAPAADLIGGDGAVEIMLYHIVTPA